MGSQALRDIYAEWLREGMNRAGWNQTATAIESGVSRDTVWRILKRRGGVSEGSLKKLSEALQWPLPELSGNVAGGRTAPSSPVEPRSGAGPTVEALAARLRFLGDQFRAYRELGRSPSPEVLAEWLQLVGDLFELRDGPR